MRRTHLSPATRAWLAADDERSRLDEFLERPLTAPRTAPRAWAATTLETLAAAMHAGRSPVSAVVTQPVNRPARPFAKALLEHLHAGDSIADAINDPATGFDARTAAVIAAYAHAGQLAAGLEHAAADLRSRGHRHRDRHVHQLARSARGLAGALMATAVAWLIVPLIDGPAGGLAHAAGWATLPLAAVVAAQLTSAAAPGLASSRAAAVLGVLVNSAGRRASSAHAATSRLVASCAAVQVRAGSSCSTALARVLPVAAGSLLHSQLAEATHQSLAGAPVAEALRAQPLLEELAGAVATGVANGDVSSALDTYARSPLPRTRPSALDRALVPTLTAVPWALLLTALVLAR